MQLAEAEAVASALVELGYTARTYPRKPSGHKVVISGRRQGRPFRVEIEEPGEIAPALRDLARGLVGTDAEPTEGEQ